MLAVRRSIQRPRLKAFVTRLLIVLSLLRASGAERHGASEPASTGVAPLRVAVIGAGIGGTSAAYFLHKKLPTAKIDILEANQVVGGRLATLFAAGREYEIGGSIIHPANRLMVQLRDTCHLEPLTDPDGGGSFALLTTSTSTSHHIAYQPPAWAGPVGLKLSLLLRYGLFSLVRLDNFVGSLLETFGQIYPLLEEGRGYPTLAEMLTAMSPRPEKRQAAAAAEPPPELIHLTQLDLATKLESLGLGRQLVEELVMVATKVNYGQLPAQLHSLVGAVSLAGTQGDLWRIKGGNYRLPECLIKLSQANLHLHTRVTEVSRPNQTTTGHRYRLHLEEPSESGPPRPATRDYDLVIVARPLTPDQPSPLKLPASAVSPPLAPADGRYHHTYTYLVHARHLNGSRLGAEDERAALPDSLFFIDPVERLASISRLRPVNSDLAKESEEGSVYKIFSGSQLTKEDLAGYFVGIKSVQPVDWLAYPHYSSNEKHELGRFELEPGLYHVNAVEWAASAMEMSALAGRNVANLAANFVTSSSKTDHRTGAVAPSTKSRVEL